MKKVIGYILLSFLFLAFGFVLFLAFYSTFDFLVSILLTLGVFATGIAITVISMLISWLLT